jgi:PAS domain S-box-containing protein
MDDRVVPRSSPSGETPTAAPDAREILDALPLAVFVKDAGSRFVYMNAACERQWGYSLAELRGADCRGYFPSDEAESYLAADREVLANRQPIEFEETVRNAQTGHHHILRTIKSPLCDAAGKPRFVLGISADITAQSRSETEYRAILNTTLDAFWINDLQGRFMDVNDVYCRMVGYRRDELLTMSLSDVEAVEQPDDTRAHIDRLVATGFDRFESQHRRKDGAIVDVEVTATYLAASDGRLIVFARDITERRRAERALRQSEAQLRAHIENSPMAVVAWDGDFKVTQWSDEAQRMFGWSAAETIGKPIMDLHLIYEPDIPLVQQTMAKLSDGVSRYVVTANRNVTKAGRVIDCIWYNSNLLSDDGLMASILSQVLEVTEQKRAEANLKASKIEAERANDAKSRFLAAVSHDLRQPLAALSLYVGAMEGKLPPADGSLLANMRDCVSHLSEMLSNLLDLSRLEAGVIVPKLNDFDLDSMLLKIVATVAPEARSRKLALRVAHFSKVGRTDPALFQRMVGNLVANAVRYTKRGGVLIGTRRRGGKLWVEVWDTGIGVPAERTAEIFEEFKQLDNSERNVAKGSGLGLAIVARTANLLGLEVRVRSRPGKGSMFAIELPLGAMQPPAKESAVTERRLRIALVEDNAQVAAALAYVLTQVGHQVVSATSGSQLLARLAGTPPDIVISDYRLGGEENGLSVIHRLRAAFSDELPAIIITGDTAPEVIRGIARQRVHVQHKPVELDVLRATMAELTGPGREMISARAENCR